MPIRVMLFDLWGTLIVDDGHREGVPRDRIRAQMAQAALASIGSHFDLSQIEEAFTVAGAELGKIHAQGVDLSTEGRTVLYLCHLCPELLDELDDPAWERMHEAILTPALQARPSVMPGAADVLAEVRGAGLLVGLISNAGITPGFVLRQILEGYGILQHFDSTIFSDEVEVSKPSAAIFERALDDFGVDPHEAAFVGDQPVLDVLGPRSAGLWSIQFGDLNEDGIEPHGRISSLEELVPELRRLGLMR
jgi:putative hydrolase of the HAD superfamily